ncbi:hypothetical protein MHU86_8372 [Fragilaria crotonensis]|nr:hypothetical protein MHU86_8372 [Fragilaria crotonensis]
MMSRFIILAALFACSNVGGEPPCSVCGAGKIVTSPDDVFILGPSPVPCGELQVGGQQGSISGTQCAQLNGIIGNGGICECAPGTLPPFTPLITDAPVGSNAPAGTEAPVSRPPTAPPTVAPTVPPTLGTAAKMMGLIMKKKARGMNMDKIVK